MRSKKETVSTQKITTLRVKEPLSNEDIQNIFKNVDFSENKTREETSIFENIQTQRHTQRKCVFWFSLCIAIGSIVSIFSIIFIQAAVRFFVDPHFSILDNNQLEIISSGVLLEVFGIIAIITRAIWNDGSYSELLTRDFISREERSK